MGIRYLKRFEDALNAAVLAAPAMQRVETRIGPKRGKLARDVPAHVHARDPVASLFKGARASRTGVQRNLALRRPASIKTAT